MYQKVIKRWLDIICCGGAMIFLWPVFLIIAVLIKLDSKGPVYFKQKRVGIHKTHFYIYKFRTMRTDTPKDMPTHLLKDPDAYITRMGKFLRKTSLDELPQILHNVLINGDMSIIGPRPALWNQYDLIEERDKYGANDVKPGISGWAQIHGRDELEIPVKAELDGYYAQHIGFLMDVRCLLGSVKSVLKSEGVVEGGTGAMEMAAAKEDTQPKKVLFVATVVRLHINMFHQPYIKWFHDQGWQVDVAANNDYDNKDECVIPYCNQFYCLPFERTPWKKGNLAAYRQLKKIIEKEHYDIIHCHTPMGSVVARLAAIRARKKGTKVIYTAHGFHFYKGAPLINWLIYYPIERILAHQTDLLITMNQEDYARANTFKAKEVAIVNGVGLDLTKFTEASMNEKQIIRQKLGLNKDDIFAISVAQLIKRKNHIVLIEAVAKLNNPHFHLFICGDGIQEKELKEKAKELGIRRQVHFLGFRRDVYQLCSSADIFLFASLQEGLPVAVMEAMACGLPIIASKIRGNIDLIDKGKGGYLVHPKNVYGFVKCIQKMTENRRRLSKMKNYNLIKIRQYGIDEVVKQMAELYQKMM